MKQKMSKKLFAFVLACLLFVLSNTAVFANSVGNEEMPRAALAYHSLTYEELGEVEHFSFDQSQGSLSFLLNGNPYEFNMELFTGDLTVKEDLPGAAVYYGENNGLKCSLTEQEDSMCINISPKHALGASAPSNRTEYLIILVGERQSIQTAFRETAESQANKQIKAHHLRTCADFNPFAKATPARRDSSLHVLAFGMYIPAILSSGVSEAWATSEHAYSNMYRVRLYQYIDVPALPGDGITLFSRYYTQPALSVWNSPANPPAGVQSVNVVAELDVTEAKLEAYTHYTALIDKIPIIYPIYDTCDID